jgi:hypothetical protein
MATHLPHAKEGPLHEYSIYLLHQHEITGRFFFGFVVVRRSIQTKQHTLTVDTERRVLWLNLLSPAGST